MHRTQFAGSGKPTDAASDTSNQKRDLRTRWAALARSKEKAAQVAALKFVTGMKTAPPVKTVSDSKLHFEAGNNFDLAEIGELQPKGG
jgi:hypothetical protein